MTFTKTWNKSKKPRKQRKFVRNAPLNIKQKLLSANLSKDLRLTHKKRSLNLRSGDKVKVMRGQFKGKIGTVDRVSLKHSRVYVVGVEVAKKEGGKSLYPLHPSNLSIIELKLEDKKRKKSLERK